MMRHATLASATVPLADSRQRSMLAGPRTDLEVLLLSVTGDGDGSDSEDSELQKAVCHGYGSQCQGQ